MQRSDGIIMGCDVTPDDSQRRFFCTAQRCNIGATLFRIAATLLPMVLRFALGSSAIMVSDWGNTKSGILTKLF